MALITLAGKPRTEGSDARRAARRAAPRPTSRAAYGATTHNIYAMCAMRHMHEFGTTASNSPGSRSRPRITRNTIEHAMLRDVVTVEDVVNSPMIADPLHRLDCCVVTDGGGAVIVTSREIAQEPEAAAGAADRRRRGAEGPARRQGPRSHLFGAACGPGRAAFAEAGVTPQDIKYASIYDSFTITVLMQLEDLGFCKKGEGGKFVADGNLISGVGKLPFNTDGGGLCNNHPVNRGGMTKIIEAVRQLRGEAHPKVQVPELRSGAGARHRRLARRAPRPPRPAFWSASDEASKNAKVSAAASATPRPSISGTRPLHDKLLIKRCTACGEPHYYPRALCPFCFSDETVWEESSGEGEIYTYSIMRRSPTGPYAIGYVTLKEGRRC